MRNSADRGLHFRHGINRGPALGRLVNSLMAEYSLASYMHTEGAATRHVHIDIGNCAAGHAFSLIDCGAQRAFGIIEVDDRAATHTHRAAVAGPDDLDLRNGFVNSAALAGLELTNQAANLGRANVQRSNCGRCRRMA